LFIVALVLSMAFVATPALAPAVVYEPGGTSISVPPGGEFTLSCRLRWDRPEPGTFSLAPLVWDSPRTDSRGKEDENYTFVGARAYFDNNDEIAIVATYSDGVSPDNENMWRHSVLVTTAAPDPRNGEFNVDVTFRASGEGGVPHAPADNHAIFFMGPFMLAEGMTILPYTPPNPYITIRVLPPSLPGKPSLVSPAEGALTNDNTPTFEWTVGADANNHRLLVDDNIDFSSPTDNNLLGADENTWTKPAPGYADGTYYWRVVAINEYGENSSDVWTFTIDTTPPERPTLISPENSKLDNKLQQAFSWTQPEPNVAYHIQIDDEPSFSSPFVHENSAVADNWYAFTFAADGAYYWRVRAKDAANNWGPWADNFKLVIDTAPPAAPAPIWPANGENINDNSPNLDWGAVSDASPPVLYRVRVSDNSAFPHDNVDSGWISADNFKLATQLREGVWYWRVQARDNAGNVGENSATRSFRVDVTSPPAPALLEPADGAMTTDNTPTFRWAAVADNSMPVTYGLQVDNDPDFSSPEIDVSGLVDNLYTPPVGLPFENYSWRVQARDNAGNVGAWSPAWTLQIIPTRGVEVTIWPSENTGVPGGTLIYRITVKNTGNVEDNYVLTVSDNLGWEPTLSDNYLTIPAGENGTAALAVAVPENTTSGMEDNITVIAASLSDNEVSAAASCIARAESASVEFDLATLYEVGLSVSARLTEGSKLVVKFYTYAGSYQGENVVWSGPTPDNVNFSITVPHPENKPVENVRLDLTYDNTENVISTIASFIVTRGVLWGRILEIMNRWPFAPAAEKEALWGEIVAIMGRWPFAPK
jgi:hypothetical protein